MTPFEISKSVTAYYKKITGPTAVSGYTKFILSDGVNMMIVEKDYKPKQGEYLFQCEIRRGEPLVTLLTHEV